MKGRRDPVKKNMDLIHKPKTFRDRKKEFKLGKNKQEHPKHAPYKRCPSNLHNLLLEDEDA